MREVLAFPEALLGLVVLIGGTFFMSVSQVAPDRIGPGRFFQVLAVSGPIAAGANAHLYDPLLGDWDAVVVDHLPGGTDRRQSAEMHFARVLEGRAIQDVWVVPALPDRTATGGDRKSGNRFGTTLRVYDPSLDAWRVTWWNPVTGVENRLVGRRVGSQIVQTGSDSDGRLIRWRFDAIGPDSFHWKGEQSEDGGTTWVCETEFSARRHAD